MRVLQPNSLGIPGLSILQSASALVPVTYITTSATPKYVLGTDGFFKSTGTIASGTEVMLTNHGIDAKSQRPIAQLPTGEILFTDKLTRIDTKVLEEVEVRSTRLWGWLALVALAGSAIGYGVYQYKKSKKKNA